jgi:hypothetical protein
MRRTGTEGSGGEGGDEQGAHELKVGMLARGFNPVQPTGD